MTRTLALIMLLIAVTLPTQARDIDYEIAQSLAAAAQAHAQARTFDADLRRLRTQLRAIDEDPSLNPFATMERLKAYRALDELARAFGSKRGHRLYIAERRVAKAVADVEAEMLREQARQLDHEHWRMLKDQRDLDALRAQALAESSGPIKPEAE